MYLTTIFPTSIFFPSPDILICLKYGQIKSACQKLGFSEPANMSIQILRIHIQNHQKHEFYTKRTMQKLSMFAGSENPNFLHALLIWPYFKHIKISGLGEKIEVG